jgi:nicotinamidase-related amidase
MSSPASADALPSDSDRAANDITLLCVDMQPVFVRAIADGTRVQRRCEFAVAAAVGLGIPVVFTEQVPEKLGGTAPELTRLAPGAPVLGKNTFSAFGEPAIRDSIVAQLGTQHLLICGIESSICVYQTAVAAIAESMHVTVLSDAVGARRPDDARTCLESLVHAGAHVLPAETVFYALLHDVTHPFFKAYTQLVKSHG